MAFLVLNLATGYGTARLSAGTGSEPLIAPAAVCIVTAMAAWFRRGCDILEVIGPSFSIAFAGFLGIAIARVPHAEHTVPEPWGYVPIAGVSRLDEQWPLVLLAGIPFALVITVAIALPISMIPVRKRVDPHADEAFRQFLADRNTPPKSPS